MLWLTGCCVLLVELRLLTFLSGCSCFGVTFPLSSAVSQSKQVYHQYAKQVYLGTSP